MKGKALLWIIVVVLLATSVNADAVTDSLVSKTVAYWKFNNTVTDFLGVYNLTDDATADTAFGVIQHAREIDANTDSLYNAGLYDVIPASWTATTISGWLWIDACDGKYMYYKSNKDGDDRILTVVEANCSINFRTEDHNGGINSIMSSSLATGQWHHIILEWSEDTGKRIYINGSLDVSAAGETTLMADGTHTDFFLAGISSVSALANLGRWDEVAIFNETLNTSDIARVSNSTPLTYPWELNGTAPIVSNITQYTEQTANIEQIGTVSLVNTNFQDIVSGVFELNTSNNLSVAFTTNAINNVGNSVLECRIEIDGNYYGSTVNRSLTTGNYGSLYLTTTVFNLTADNHTTTLQCRRVSGSPQININSSHGIIHILQDQDTQTLINWLNQTVTASITGNTYSKLATINFTTTSNNRSDDAPKFLVLDSHIGYMHASTGTITLYAVINGTIMGEYPRYGTAGSTGIVGGLMMAELNPNINTSQNITVEIYGKSATSDGSISGNLILKEFILLDTEINTTKLNDTTFTGGYSTLKSIVINNSDHTDASLVVKAGIPHRANASARTTFRLKVNSDMGATITRDVSAANQDGVAIIQDDFQIGIGIYTVSLEGTSDQNITLTGGDLTSYLTNVEEFTPNDFNVTIYDVWDNTTLGNFTVYNSGGTAFTTNGSTVTITSNMTTEDLTIVRNNYFNKTILNHNTSNDLNASMIQAIIDVRVKNSVSGVSLTNFFIEMQYGNVNTTNGSAIFYMNNGTWAYNLTSTGYQDSSGTISVSILDNKIVTLYMNPTITFNLLRESDGLPFNVSETNETKMTVFCPTSVDIFDYKTTNASSIVGNITCNWDFLKLDITVGTNSYFRTLIPANTSTSIDWYVIDLTEETAVQLILVLNDLTGDYSDGIVRIKRYVNGTEQDIIEQYWDVENKVNLYLIKNGFYTLTLIDEDGNELNLGDLIADSAGTKTITIPEIPFIPEAYIGDLISWEWDFNTTRIRLQYNDTSPTGTTNITFTIYNGSSPTNILYSTTSTNVSYAAFSYITPVLNASYLGCLLAYHPVEGEISECRQYYNGVEIGEWGVWGADGDKWKNWVSAFIIIIIILMFTSHIAVGMSFDAIVIFALMQWQWLDFGSPTLNYTLLSLWVVLAVLMFYIEGGKK